LVAEGQVDIAHSFHELFLELFELLLDVLGGGGEVAEQEVLLLPNVFWGPGDEAGFDVFELLKLQTVDFLPAVREHELDGAHLEDVGEVLVDLVVAFRLRQVHIGVLIVEELLEELVEADLVDLVGHLLLRDHDPLADVAVGVHQDVVLVLQLVVDHLHLMLQMLL